MFESKSPVIRIGAYIIIGFFTLIIVISFGMPDIMSKLNMNENVAAIVNGHKIYRIDYIRYRDSMARQLPNADKKEMQDMILTNMIMRRLVIQEAENSGIKVSDDRVMRNIKNFFKDQNGKFSRDYMDRYLISFHMGFTDFFLMIKEDMLLNEFRQMISIGAGVSPEEIKTDYSIDNSKIQIKYSYISTPELNKRYKDKITVTEKEIDNELQKSKSELKDPATDRKRIKDKLEKIKFNAMKNELIQKIDKLADDKRSFDEAAANLGGSTSVSNIFKIGDPIKEGSDKGKMLYSITNSEIFIKNFLAMEYGKTSRVIDSFDGLYIFTTLKKEFALRDPAEKDFTKIENSLMQEKSESLFMAKITELRDKAKIIRNLKFN
jgi:hypothetical protein